MAISLTLFTSNARQGHILCMRLRQLWSASLPNWRGLFKYRRIQQSTCPTLPKHVSTKPRELNIHPLNPWEICFFKSSRSKNLTKMRISEKDGCFFYVAFPPRKLAMHRDFFASKKKLMTDQSPSWGQWLSRNLPSFTPNPSCIQDWSWPKTVRAFSTGRNTAAMKVQFCVSWMLATRKKTRDIRSCVQLKQRELR